ncbi:hypothetical protein GCM10027592_03280 [Spirosoma flavus]
MTLKTIVSAFVISFSISLATMGQSPNPVEGSVSSKGPVVIDGCNVSSITIKYRISQSVGEPAIYTNIKWTGTSSNDDCLSSKSFRIFLNVGRGGFGYYLASGGSYGMIVGKGNNQYGDNPLAGSPNWDELITRSFRSNNVQYLSEEEAKRVWKDGIRVVGAIIVTRSGQVIEF